MQFRADHDDQSVCAMLDDTLECNLIDYISGFYGEGPTKGADAKYLERFFSFPTVKGARKLRLGEL